jgi:hypothetical protein
MLIGSNVGSGKSLTEILHNHDMEKHSHYKKDVSHLKMIDVYRVLNLFEVTDPCVQHAVKKLLCAGKRGGKSKEQDIREAVDSLNRALQMIAEDSKVTGDVNA